MKDHTRQMVILAAGLGSRLGSAEAGVPKPLIEIGGAPLIAHALAHAEAGGCREAVVVTGYAGAQVRAAIEALRTPMLIRFVETPDATAPNGHSLLAAEPHAAERFFLQMVDHVYAQPVLPLLDQQRASPADACCLLVDREPDGLDLADATKVQLEGDRIVGIGKQLPSWQALDTGCFVLTRSVFDALRDVPSHEPLTVSSAMRGLAARRALFAIDIGRVRWADVDTPADREFAARLLTTAAAER